MDDLEKLLARHRQKKAQSVRYEWDLKEDGMYLVDKETGKAALIFGDKPEIPLPKTADEMFRDLGYQPVETGYQREYRKTDPNGNKIKICVAHGNNMSMTCEGKAFWMIAEEILACAQLIKEMEK